ncbi:MAG: NAD(+)/NADH kinase [Candidatus Lokiarchaeota archaeon]|nr:NAD(+)/NADH kinase [Candidatus Lokiarchaeota archaeon]
MIKSIALTAPPNYEEAMKFTKSFVRFLQELGLTVFLEHNVAEKLKIQELAVELSELDDLDLLIVAGGDGSILYACNHLADPSIPMLCIDFSRKKVGFMTEIKPEDAKNAVKQILAGNYTLELRDKITAKLNDDLRLPDALNEIVVTSSKPLGVATPMLHLGVQIDNTLVADTYLDALIASTTTGSTAHSLSAGGPIITPSLNAFIIMCVNPLELPYRVPVVVPTSSNINVTIYEPTAQIVMDGHSFDKEIRPGDVLNIFKSENAVKFIRLKGITDFYERVFKKLTVSRIGEE